MISRKTGQPLTPTNITPMDIIDLWQRSANRLAPARERILDCRDIRRGLAGVEIPQSFLDRFPEAIGWVGTPLPERQMWDINLVNQLSESDPSVTRTAMGQTDTAGDDSDKLETWDNSVLDDLFSENGLREIRGRAVQDGEFAVIVGPAPKELALVDDYEAGEESDWYDRDDKGKPKDAKGYAGKRSERHSAKAHEEARVDWIASHFPVERRIVDATDCAPVLVRGRTETWEARHLLIRTLFEKEELIGRKMSWDGMADKEHVQRAYDADSAGYGTDIYGRGNMVYLYEAYLTLEDDDGKDRIVCAKCIGGRSTWASGTEVDPTDDGKTVEVVDYTDEYGIRNRFWDYFWGLRLADEPAFAGMPLMYPLLGVLKALEAMLAGHGANAWNNVFSGSVIDPNDKLDPNSYMNEDRTKLLTFDAPGSGELVVAPGKVTPYAQAVTGPDAQYLEGFYSNRLEMNQPDKNQTVEQKGASGHAMMVNQRLMEVGKSDIRRTVLQVTKFAAFCVNMWACAFEEKLDVTLAVYATESIPGEGIKGPKEINRPMEINTRWIGKNYRVQASYTDVANIAEIDLAMSAAERGFGSDEDVYKAMGKTSTIEARVQAAAYQYWRSPQGQQHIAMILARRRQDDDMIELLTLQSQGEVQPDGTPNAAISPELRAPGGGPTPAGNALPQNRGDNAQKVRAGIESGQMGNAAANRDAMATSGLAPVA